MTTNKTFIVHFQADTGMTVDEAERGLRALLKCSLRQFGLRCTSATTATPTTTAPAIREHDRHQAVAKWAQQKYGPGWSLTQDWFALEAEFSKQQPTNDSGAQE